MVLGTLTTSAAWEQDVFHGESRCGLICPSTPPQKGEAGTSSYLGAEGEEPQPSMYMYLLRYCEYHLEKREPLELSRLTLEHCRAGYSFLALHPTFKRSFPIKLLHEHLWLQHGVWRYN